MRVRIAFDQLEGYENCKPEDIKQYSNNELSYIFCDNCLSAFSFQDYEKHLKLIISKLRIGGKINIIGVDLRTLCAEYMYTDNTEKMNLIIENSKSIINYQDVENILISSNLKIESLTLQNIYYNIEASR